jgi:hypothetical protein
MTRLSMTITCRCPEAPGTAKRDAARLAGIGLLAAGVAAALFVAGRPHTPDYICDR